FIKTHTSAITSATTAFAAAGATQDGEVICVYTEGKSLVGAHRQFLFAVPAHAPHQALCLDGEQRGAEQEVFDAHVLQARHRTGGIIGVQRGEHQVAGQRRLDGDVGSLAVADLADHQNVRVLAHDGTQTGGKAEADARVHLDLCDAGQLVFHRVFHGDNLVFLVADLVERGVERGGLAATGGAGDENQPVG